MVAFTSIVPVLKVADMARAVEFYTGVLGFTICWRGADDTGDNCMLAAGPAAVLLSTGAHLGDTPKFTGTLYFNMTGVRGYYEQLLSRAEIVWPLEAMDYGQTEFGIKDPDGYVLAFAEPAEDESDEGGGGSA